MGLQGMFMRTWDYNGFAVGPVLASLEHIFDQKIMDSFGKMIFWMCDKSAGSANINAKMLGKAVYNLSDPKS